MQYVLYHFLLKCGNLMLFTALSKAERLAPRFNSFGSFKTCGEIEPKQRVTASAGERERGAGLSLTSDVEPLLLCSFIPQ